MFLRWTVVELERGQGFHNMIICDLGIWPCDLKNHMDHPWPMMYRGVQFVRWTVVELKFRQAIVHGRTYIQTDPWPLTLDPVNWKSIWIMLNTWCVYIWSVIFLHWTVVELEHGLCFTIGSSVTFTYDLAIWSCDLEINRDHPLSMRYLGVQFDVPTLNGYRVRTRNVTSM
jgi:hypothetical protein